VNIRINEGCSIAVNAFGNCVLQTRVIFSLVLSCHIRVSNCMAGGVWSAI